MKILFLSSQYPHSETKAGGAKRLYQIAKALSARHEIHLVAMDGCAEGITGALAPDFFATARFLPMQVFSGWRRYSQPGIAPKIPDEDLSRLSKFLDQEHFDVLLLAYSQALWFSDWEPLASIPRRVYMEDDLLLRASPKWPTLRQRISKWRLARYYHRKFSRLDAVVCINELERDIIEQFFPGTKTYVVGYGIDLADFPFQPREVEKPRVAGFIGNYKHSPNEDALRWLVRSLFPAMKKAFPDMELIAAGVHFPDWFHKEVRDLAGVSFLENVEPLSEFYRRIDVFLNPILSGGGLRTKLVEAAAFGVPIISTALGAQGLESMRIYRAENEGEFITQWKGLIEANYQSRIDSSLNRERVESAFSNHTQGLRLEQALTGAKSEREPTVPA